MGDRIRLILAVRAAGLLVVGLTLPWVIALMPPVVRDVAFQIMWRGHPDAVLGMFTALLGVVGDYGLFFWQLLLLAAGVLTITMGRRRLMRITQRLEWL